MEKNDEFCERIALRRIQSELVFPPCIRDIVDPLQRVGLPTRLVRLKCDGNFTGETSRLQPKVSVIGNTLVHGNSSLADASPLTIVCRDIHTQGMLDPLRLKIRSGRIENGIIPPEMECGIVVTVVGFSLPVAWQADRVGMLIKTP